MSAFAVVMKRNEAIVATDGASYESDGVLCDIDLRKTFIFPALDLTISYMGAKLAGSDIALKLSERFNSFDDVVIGAEEAIHDLVDDYLDERIWIQGNKSLKLYIVGYSRARMQPEAYAMGVCAPEQRSHWKAVHERQGVSHEDQYKLKPMKGCTSNPPLDATLLEKAGLYLRSGESEADLLERLDDTDMLAILLMQRLEGVTFEPQRMHWVGGHVLITSITKNGISQRVTHRWEEDQIGEIITPRPVDWSTWRGGGSLSTAGMSRLQRQMLERKQLKLRKRA